jgi:hypothetical protein
MKPKVVIPPLKKPIVPLLQIGKIGKMVGNIPLGSPKDLPQIDKMLNARKAKNMYTSDSQSPLFDFYVKPPVCNTGEADYLNRFFLASTCFLQHHHIFYSDTIIRTIL